MSTRQIKNEVIAILEQPDLQVVYDQLCKYEEKDLINPLISSLFHTDEMKRWHAVSALGQITAKLADQEMEKARIVMRRLIWSLNDESGGIGWGAPEAMAEIIYNHDQLAEEYLHMLISYCREDGPEPFQDGNFLELPHLQRGLLWGIGRVAGKRGITLIANGVVSDLNKYLQSDDATVCAMAIWGLGQLKAENAVSPIKEFLDDEREVRFYFEGQLTTESVKKFAINALTLLQKN